MVSSRQPFHKNVIGGQCPCFIETTNSNFTSKRDPEGLGTKNVLFWFGWDKEKDRRKGKKKKKREKKKREKKKRKRITFLIRRSREVFTAKESSMGSSGGTTDVKTKVHSKRSFFLLRLGSFKPYYCYYYCDYDYYFRCQFEGQKKPKKRKKDIPRS